MALIWEHVRKYKKLLALALILAAINQIFSLLDPIIFRHIIDSYATQARDLPFATFVKGVLLLLLASVGVAFVSRTAKNFQEYYVSMMTQRVGADLYERSVQHTFQLPFSVFEDRRSGEILQKLQKARTDTQAAIESAIGVLFLAVIGILFVVIYAFTVNWMVGLTFLLMIPLLGVTSYFISRKIKATQKKIVTQTAELAGSTTETIRNVELVKGLGLEDQEIKRLNHVNSKILALELEKTKQVRTLNFIQGTLINGLRSALLFLLLYLIWNGSITLGAFFSLLFYSFFVFNPLASFGTVAAQYQEAKASTEALQEILSLPPEPKPQDAKDPGSINTIAMRDVTFTYPSGTGPSVQDISFTLTRGKTIALAGASGSGKTTVAKLLTGLYKPSKGTIEVNNIPHSTLDFDAYRQTIGVVSQETQLFAGTIKENLLFVKPDASDEECMRALKSAQAMPIIERGGKGLLTRIGEGGVKLSGGERQRIAIARALLREPEFLIFDEATSALDSLTEKEISETIKQVRLARPNLLMLVIAHRLSTVVHADHIIVLSRGKVVEQGTHSELLQNSAGLYAAFWKQQTES